MSGAAKAAKRAAGNAFLGTFGWRAEGDTPEPKKYVLIAAPHRSNWDFPFTLALAWALDVKMRWLGKHTLFEGPLGGFLKSVGGVPVIRHERRNMVDQMADLFAEHDELALVVPAEGTRSRRPYWKSGFYHIASKAGVPIVPGFLDYARKRGGFGEPIVPSGDLKADMDRIRAFYADKVGKFPAKFGPVRLREELPVEPVVSEEPSGEHPVASGLDATALEATGLEAEAEEGLLA